MFVCDECKAKTKNADKCSWAGRKKSICLSCKNEQNKKWSKYAVVGKLGFSMEPPISALDTTKGSRWLK